MLIGTPIAICLGMSSIFTIIADAGTRPLDTVMSVVPMLVSSSSSKFVLLAIPFLFLVVILWKKLAYQKNSFV